MRVTAWVGSGIDLSCEGGQSVRLARWCSSRRRRSVLMMSSLIEFSGSKLRIRSFSLGSAQGQDDNRIASATLCQRVTMEVFVD